MNTGTLVISLDFELHWGVRDKRSVANYRQHLLGVREAIPQILKLFRQHEIRATWATVGFLFCESKSELLAHLPSRQPQYTNHHLSPYSDIPQLGEDEQHDPYHFAPSLLEQIAKVPGQEIASHTLSHYYCLEEGQHPEDFAEDLEIAQTLAQKKLGYRLKSLVFPRNQYSPPHLQVAYAHGFCVFRGNPSSWMYHTRANADDSRFRRAFRLIDSYLPVHQPSLMDTSRSVWLPKVNGSIYNVPASTFLRPYSRRLRRLEDYRYQRLDTAMQTAASSQQIFHLWWHPHNFGINLQKNLRALEHILTTFDAMRTQYGMKSLRMDEIAALTSSSQRNTLNPLPVTTLKSETTTQRGITILPAGGQTDTLNPPRVTTA
ncbi:MAG: polysaccharide deacetylase family protein [Myxococcales bacterium]|nr:polysaccharide deacetylase family protein [Myxococcales bacterium]